VTRLDHVRLPGTELGLRAILVPHDHPPGLNDTDMPNMAALVGLGPNRIAADIGAGGSGSAVTPPPNVDFRHTPTIDFPKIPGGAGQGLATRSS
jgi:hypothetical protein